MVCFNAFVWKKKSLNSIPVNLQEKLSLFNFYNKKCSSILPLGSFYLPKTPVLDLFFIVFKKTGSVLKYISKKILILQVISLTITAISM